MKWENVRAPAARKVVPPIGPEGPPRRYLSGRMAAAIGAALIVLIVALIVIVRKPSAPELLRPAGAAAVVPPAPAAKEYRSENVILRFPESTPAETPADRRR
jgi:hypothetical protein